MKVFLGKHRSWIGPYQIASALCFWARPVKDELGYENEPDWVHDFGTWLAEDRNGNDSWLCKFCNWVQEHKKRRTWVHIDNYDVWSMDHTLALIIHPLLLRLKTQKHGYARKGLKNKWDWDNYAEARYSWMLDELIWTFEQLADEDDGESQFYDHTESNKEKDFAKSMKKLRVDRAGLEAHQKRIENGLRLFGKYFRTLWD